MKRSLVVVVRSNALRILMRSASFALLSASFASRGGAQSMTPSGNPAKLTVVASPGAGSAPTAVTNTLTTYSLGANVTTGRKITVSINLAMPSGMTLEVQLAAPGGATSAGFVSLGTTAQNAVTNLPTNLGTSGHVITYRFSATSAAGKLVATARTVAFTIVAGP